MAVFTGIAPSPAQRGVKQAECIAGLKLDQAFGLIVGLEFQSGCLRDRPLEWFSIMRGNHSPGERNIRQVGAIGVKLGIG